MNYIKPLKPQLLRILYLVIALCLCGKYSRAAEVDNKPIITKQSSALGDFGYSLSLDQWQSEGNFRMLGGPPNAYNRWELTHPVDSNILLWSFEVHPIDRKYELAKEILNISDPYYFSVSFGQGDINNGIIRDTDWDANGTVSDLSYSTSHGNNKLFLSKVGFRLTGDSSFHPANRPVLYFTLGYFYLKQTARYYDPLMTISSYNPVNISWTENWDTYDLLYSGNEIGFTGHSMITGKLNLDISMGYIPSLIASYDGLRYPERVTSSQRPEEISATGDGFNYTIGLAYQPVKNLSIQAGYRYIHLWTKGEDQPGTSWSGSWEKLSTDMKGLSFGITYNF